MSASLFGKTKSAAWEFRARSCGRRQGREIELPVAEIRKKGLIAALRDRAQAR